MQAIETRYKGYNFRSRLEARWAVYFDTISVKWEYEKEGFQLPNHWYLPDFYFPDMDLWAEVKPTTEAIDMKMDEFVQQQSIRLLVLVGPPRLIQYRVLWASWKPVSSDDGKRDLVGCDCILSGERNIWGGERQFYFLPPGHNVDLNEESAEWNCIFTDAPSAVEAARSARFEFGQSGSTV